MILRGSMGELVEWYKLNHDIEVNSQDHFSSLNVSCSNSLMNEVCMIRRNRSEKIKQVDKIIC